MDYIFRPPTEADARAILGWRYRGIYAAYNANPSRLAAGLASLLDPANRYFAIFAPDGTLSGFCCFGAEARVPGGEYTEPPALDVGLGMRPDLTDGGRGLKFFRAILAAGECRYDPPRFRLTVATFNERAQRVYERAGFCSCVTFRRGGERDALEFLLMLGPSLRHKGETSTT